MKRLVAGAAIACVALAACGSSASKSQGKVNSTADTETSQQLAERLKKAGLCVSIGRATGDGARAAAAIGITGVWVCNGPTPTAGSQGGTETGTWAASSRTEKERVLQKALSGYGAACSGPGGVVGSKSSAVGGSESSDGNTTTIQSAPAQVTTRYVEGPDWLAFVGIGANLDAIATALGGHAVTKHCG